MVKTYKQEYARLNAEQRQAVDYIEGPLLVIAGPGTGKTQLLSLRVANILQKTDADPENILCLTFTNKAAGNMRSRLGQLVGPEAKSVTVKTFHSLAADIINQYPDNFWAGAKLSVAPDAIQTEIIQNILASLPHDNPLSSTFNGNFTALPDVRQALKLCKEAGLTPEELNEVIKQNLAYLDVIEPKLVDLLTAPLAYKNLTSLQPKVDRLPKQKPSHNLVLALDEVIKESLDQAISQDAGTNKTKNTGKWKARWLQTINGQKGLFKERSRNQWWLAVADVYQEYRQSLHQRGYYDYADMLIEVLEQLDTHSDMLADLQEHFRYVLIDEFQDTNAAQLRLARLIADHYSNNGRPNIMAVGDDDQSIFAFNGAELSNLLGFKRSYPMAKIVVLTQNYRSRQAVLDYADRLINQAGDRLVKREPTISKKLTSATNPGAGQIRHLSYPTSDHQFSELAKHIKALWRSGERDVAVLARKHQSLQKIAAALNQIKIPIKYERRSNILEHEAVVEICQMARLISAISDGNLAKANLLLANILPHPMWAISPKSLWKLAVSNYSDPDWLGSLLDSQDSTLNQIGNWLTQLARLSQNQPLIRILDLIIGLNTGGDFTSPFKDYYLEKSVGTSASAYIETLSAVNLLIDMSAEFADGLAKLSDFVRFIDLNDSTGSVLADESWFVSGKQAVELLTVHKAKGLEFDHVFIVDVMESMWRPRVGGRGAPANLRLKAYGEAYDDYVRLLYVAITRARRSITASSYFTDIRGQEALASPLLLDLEVEPIVSTSEQSVAILHNAVRWPQLSLNDQKLLLAERLDDYSLSPTALIDFLNIAEAGPQSFFERHLLRIPRAHSPAGAYGTAIHAALETAQRLVNTSTLESGTVLDRFDSEITRQNLSPTETKLYKKRGHDLLHKLLSDKTLHLTPGALTEQRIAEIEIGAAKINGKLDRIDIIDSTQIMISDYKTGKPLTSFDTKDQAKQVKAWRHRTQLIFYGLLVKNSPRFKKYSLATQMIYLEAENNTDIYLKYLPGSDDLNRLAKLIEVVYQKIQNLDMPITDKFSQDFTGIINFENYLLGK